MTITHAFVSVKDDGSDPTLVNPSNWNAAHVATTQIFTATASQTIFVPTFTVLSTSWVFRNGVKQYVGVDWNVSAGTTVFVSGVGLGDTVEIIL
jgi:hypothetical protein